MSKSGNDSAEKEVNTEVEMAEEQQPNIDDREEKPIEKVFIIVRQYKIVYLRNWAVLSCAVD